ncbi:D-lactate dehydrogenase [cytochrome], mitochondrial [Vanrija pseudolonga]|uniref:D-lactate dehydrogenase (cytochrome) n=1 Tax=Vanrija pseudolonga TaxID=143232 RepID=A0AAF0YCW1_9TREE|nr:D-lactate dehydrogenase [cytochrome], mitochondrial [Vanrija pseudolonga]
MFSRAALPLRASVRSSTASSLRSAPRLQARQTFRFQSTQSGRPTPEEQAKARKSLASATAFLNIALILSAGAAGFAIASTFVQPAFAPTLIDSGVAIRLQDLNQPKYGTPTAYRSAIAEIQELWKSRNKEDSVSTDEDDLSAHGISDWSYHEAHRPTVVVWVDSTSEVQDLVRIAQKYRIPITPFAGGTSLEGHYSSPYGGISIDLSRLDKVVSLSVADGEAVVQAGVKWDEFNEQLKKDGVKLFFPLDPGPGATIGGMAGTGCSGTNAVRYGTAKAEWFINFTVVLPTGEVIKTRSNARKSSAGWDATKLFIGAEGSLGIITEATIRLAPALPTKVAIVNFPSVEEAVRAATEVVNEGYPVQCVEYLDGRTIRAINLGGLAGRSYPETDTLFFKFQGSEAIMKETAKAVKDLTSKHGGKGFEFSRTDKEAADLWEGRKAALWSVLALRPDGRVWTTDVCVPISKLPRLVQETSEDFEKRGLEACHFGHVGDGNVHSLALFSNDDELHRVKEAVHDMVERAIRLGGTCTGEHGVGIGKIEYLDTELGEGTVNLMETVKRTIDPHNLFNPGKIYPHIRPPHANDSKK